VPENSPDYLDQALCSRPWRRSHFGNYCLLVRFQAPDRTDHRPRTPAPITSPGTPDQTQTTAMYVPVVIDLTNVSPTRGSKQVPGGSVPQIIPSRSLLDLSLRLPLGSEERLFSITLRSGRHIVWSESTQARRQNGDTLLRVHADFRDVPTGRYNLQVASTGRRLSVPVLIRGGLPKNKEQKR
jgi:hypothetical protein